MGFLYNPFLKIIRNGCLKICLLFPNILSIWSSYNPLIEPCVRPISPHLPIYKVQITSFLSITHRLAELFIYGLGMLWILLLALCAFTPLLDISPPPAVFLWVGIGIVNIALSYHLLSTLRYLFWDWGLGFEHVALTGWLSIGLSWVMGLLPFLLIF